ncbi:hypothetical protein WMF31_39040 [Sorangium sp. So ce1036]|uniref:hypothetical protein n=1 Tax=Sorangium sp. So ce1036 TaxID=3133328 RepID=UPI003F0C6BAA
MSRVVARGAIRVDARRAVQKLREHLLVDLDLYLLELVRAAAAGGATRIDLDYDADDVSLTFDGEPLDAPVLTRLLDHLLNPTPDEPSRRLRLLALGVNAALGLRPARVDLLTTGRGPSGEAPGATCARVRFTPALLEAPAEPLAPAAAPACDEVPRPPGMPASGMRIEVRRRLGWSVLKRAITGDLPPELGHLAAATGDFPIPITLGGEPLRRASPTLGRAVLLRVPFRVRGVRSAALEIVAPPSAPDDAAVPSSRAVALSGPQSSRSGPQSSRSGPQSSRSGPQSSRSGPQSSRSGPQSSRSGPQSSRAALRSSPLVSPLSTPLPAPLAPPPSPPLSPPLSGLPVIDYLERGVRLVRQRWSFAPRFPSAPYQGVELPVRIVADADELPTNASRSALREDAPLRPLLREAATAALLDALAALTALVCGDGAVPESVAVVDLEPDRLEDALAAFACVATGAARAGDALPAAAEAVRALPLLRDGLGRPVSLASLDARDGSPLFLLRGDADLPDELSPWAHDVLRCRGGLVERALAGLPLADAEVMFEQARLGAERRRAFLRHATGEPVVPPSPEHALRAAFHEREGPLTGLRGELAVFAGDGDARRRAEVRVFVEGRHLETVELDPAAVPLPVEIALAWEGRVRPRFSYEGVERDERFFRAVRHALRVALAAADREARRLFGPRPVLPGAAARGAPSERELARLRAPLRAAIGALFCAPPRLGVPDGQGGVTPPPGDDLAPSAFEGLLKARIWPMLVTGRFMSLEGLSALARASRGLCVAPPDARGRAVDGRPVLAASQRELDWLAAALPDRELVLYTPGLFTEDELAARGPARRRALAAALEELAGPGAAGAPVLEVVRPGSVALVTPSDAMAEAWHHAAQPLAAPPRAPLLGPVAIAIDDDAAVPGRGWGSLLSPRNDAAVHAAERELCEALVAALEGDGAARARLGLRGDPLRDRGRPDTRVTAYLLDCARAIAEQARRSPVEPALGELGARLRRLSLLRMLDARGEVVSCSLETIEAAHPGRSSIPVLHEAPGFETLSWYPVLVRDDREGAAFLRWAGGRAAMAHGGLPARRRRAALERERRAAAGEGPRRDAAARSVRGAPVLPGAPPHPRLRVRLAALHVREAEGELEIIEGPASDVRLVGPDGAERRVEAELPIPLRIVARTGADDPSRAETRALLTKLARVAGRYLISLAPRFDELPPFARSHTRRGVLTTLASGKRLVARAASAPVFQDIEGRYWSLDDLRRAAAAGWLCTSAPPPYPKRSYGRPVLRLSEAERLQLSTAVLVNDATLAIARDLAAEARLAAPPLVTIGLDEAARAACFEVTPFEPWAGARAGEPVAYGEMGLLVPERAGAAKIAVHVGRRPLCAIDAGEGWPLCAAINDDALAPNDTFDGLGKSADAERLRRAVREAAARWLRAELAPPADALATRWVDVVQGWQQLLLVIGVLWLPARWPRAPRVLVATPTAGAAGGASGGGLRGAFTPRELRVDRDAGGVIGRPPVEGMLLVWPPGGRWDAVAELAMQAAASMAAELSDEPAAAPYLWNLHLLDRLEGGTLAARTVAGERVGPAEIRAELAARRRLWISDGRGGAGGDFPGGAPSFVLLDEGSPLVEVLRHRAAPGVLRELGAPSAPAPAGGIAAGGEGAQGGDDAAGGEGAQGGEGATGGEGAPCVPGAEAVLGAQQDPERVPAVEVAAGAPRSERGVRAWASALWRGVRDLIGGGDARLDAVAGPQGEAESPLAAALLAAVLEMGLEGAPVRSVVERRSGRPVRYDASRCQIVINPEHEALAWLRARGAPDPAAVALLAAAAVGEVNRALKSVTDAEERRALEHLLRSMG